MKSLAIKAHMLMIQKRAELQGDRGATAVEYGLLVALIAVVIIAAVLFLGGQLSGIFGEVATQVSNA
jgi:pilus assembly protein Flp/PilA